jgi:hypothetical protein
MAPRFATSRLLEVDSSRGLGITIRPLAVFCEVNNLDRKWFLLCFHQHDDFVNSICIE